MRTEECIRGSRAAPRRAHWVTPELVAELRYSEWTRDGRLRHPAFLGLLEDKSAAEVVIVATRWPDYAEAALRCGVRCSSAAA